MIETHAGLPNTCHDCGEPQTETWFATSDDAAIAGQGVCAPCLGKREGGTAVGVSVTLEVTNPALAAAYFAEEIAALPTVAVETPLTPDPLPSGEGDTLKKGKSAAAAKKGKGAA